MGCHYSHPESKIYEHLENLNLAITDSQINDEALCGKIDKTIEKIEKIMEKLTMTSPFVSVEIQLCIDGLQKARPKVARSRLTKFHKLLELTDTTYRRRKSSTGSSGSQDRERHSIDSTAPSSPASLRKNLPLTAAAMNRNQRNLSGSTQRCSTVRTGSNDNTDEIIVVKLKSLYQNTMNHSQDTLDEYGFFEDSTVQ